MDWSFEDAAGAVTIRQDGEKALCQAIHPADGKGLYKAWLKGAGGEILLGTLIPEGGTLRLRRVMEISALQKGGAWPPEGARITMAYAFSEGSALPPDWCWTDCPARLLKDPLLSHCLKKVRRALLKRDMEGFFLALPWSVGEPFPLPPLFCLSRIELLAGRRCALFRFSRQGEPEPLYNNSAPGENRSGT